MELLLAYHLLTLLTAPYKVRHDLLGGSKRQVLKDLEASTADLARHLIREALELSEADPLV